MFTEFLLDSYGAKIKFILEFHRLPINKKDNRNLAHIVKSKFFFNNFQKS